MRVCVHCVHMWGEFRNFSSPDGYGDVCRGGGRRGRRYMVLLGGSHNGVGFVPLRCNWYFPQGVWSTLRARSPKMVRIVGL